MDPWHTQEISGVLNTLGVNSDIGLTEQAVTDRYQSYGPNALKESRSKSVWKLLLEQFSSLLVLLLITAALVSGVILGEWIDATVIGVIVILNAILGFRQEYRAEKAMAALKRLSTPVVRVLRNGTTTEIKSDMLVPGDIIHLEAGNIVPADCRLLETAELRVQESALTGESLPVNKSVNSIDDGDTPLGDRKNMVYLGTVVSYGRARAAVVETGMRTELGKIANQLQGVAEEPTPLQKQLQKLGIYLVILALLLIAIVVLVGLFQGESLRTLFLTAVSMSVAAVPEGLPAVITIALALGAQRMLRRKALIRKLPAVETLGSVTTICSDKTGTLTQNRMTATLLWVGDRKYELESNGTPAERRGKQPYLEADPLTGGTLAAAALCSDAVLSKGIDSSEPIQVLGDPTEGALIVAALEHGLSKVELETMLPRVGEAPFDSERKRMATVHALPSDRTTLPRPISGLLIDSSARYLFFVKGASNSVLEVCDQRWVKGQVESLTNEIREQLSDQNSSLAADGIRVLAVACKPSAQKEASADRIERKLVFLGWIGMVDPVRPEAVEAVQSCVAAGIRVVMITGDHPMMAKNIASQLQMVSNSNTASNPSFATGREIEQMDDLALKAAVKHTQVFARVSPDHKLRIVDALQACGHVVAMTGDGVNDAPALKSADIGVAMGITGTDVSKEASHMVLQDDNFATIVAAVEEGRTIFANIRRFVRFLLSCNTGELWIFLIAPILGMPLPLLPVQILWMNLVTDGFPALALGVEGKEKDVMEHPPRDPKSSIIDLPQAVHIGWVGLLIAALSLGIAYLFFTQSGSDTTSTVHHIEHRATLATTWQTILFTSMVFSQLLLALAERSDRNSLLSIGLFTNLHLLYAVGITFLLQLAVIYLPLGNTIFCTKPLDLIHLSLTMAGAILVFLAVEVEKWIKRR